MAGRRVLFSAQKNEGPFILEWVAFHKVIGFTDIVVVSNDCADGSDVLLDALQDAGELRHIRQTVPDGVAPQKNAANLVMAAGLFGVGDWVIWLDLDEFLVPGPAYGTTRELIAALEAAEADALALNWCMIGSNEERGLPDRLISDRFTSALRFRAASNEVVKTLFRFDSHVAALTIHRPAWRPEGKPPRVLSGAGKVLDQSFAFARHRNGSLPARVMLTGGRYAWGQINHYAIRTSDLYSLKRLRGDGSLPVTIKSGRYNAGPPANFCDYVRNDTSILRYETGTGQEIQRLLSGKPVAIAHQNCVAHVRARLAEIALARGEQAPPDRFRGPV